MKIRIFIFSVLFSALLPSALRAGLFYSDTIVTNDVFSAGFRNDGSVYFLHERKIFRDGNDSFLFLPVSIPDKVLSLKIGLFRLDKSGGKISLLADIPAAGNRPVNIRYTMFTRSGKLIVFAFLSREPKNRTDRSALDIFVWNGQKNVLVPVQDKKTRAYYEAYFPNYTLPLVIGDDMISVSELTNRYLKYRSRD